MVSHPEVRQRLRHFVCVRLDWEQMRRLKGRLVAPTQGNQVLLDPAGRPIEGLPERGRRYPVDELIRVLDGVLAKHPPDPRTGDDLRLEWFTFDAAARGLPQHAGAPFLARVDRKPLVTLHGEIPEWIERRRFLDRHLRQFVWTRGREQGSFRIDVRQLEPEDRTLASLGLLVGESPEDAAKRLGAELDRAWREHMATRPLVARGYIDNPHGRWLRPVLERVHEEELRLREEARRGTLAPPGRERSDAR